MLTGEKQETYVDFKYYVSEYHGTSISLENFDNVELEAEAYINSITFGRIKKLRVVPKEVKMAICSVCEVIHRQEKTKNNPVKSENNDGYAVTFSDVVKTEECEKEMHSKAKKWLLETGLMYKGWSRIYDN